MYKLLSLSENRYVLYQDILRTDILINSYYESHYRIYQEDKNREIICENLDVARRLAKLVWNTNSKFSNIHTLVIINMDTEDIFEVFEHVL